MEGPHLTVMLTHHDITVPNAMDIFLEAKDAPADYRGRGAAKRPARNQLRFRLFYGDELFPENPAARL